MARGDYFSQSEVFSEDFYDDTLGDQVYLAGKNLDGSFIKKVPVEVSHELMALGQKSTPSFVRFVMVLLVMATGDEPYGVLAASYHDDRLRSIEDGYLYDVITNGKGLMYGLKGRITPEGAIVLITLCKLHKTMTLTCSARLKSVS